MTFYNTTSQNRNTSHSKIKALSGANLPANIQRQRNDSAGKNAAQAALGKNSSNASAVVDSSNVGIPFGHYGRGENQNDQTRYSYMLHDAARDLLSSNYAVSIMGKSHPIRNCLRKVAHGKENAAIQVNPTTQRAKLTNVHVCKNPHACPICAPRVNAGHARDIQGIVNHLAASHIPILITLTTHHTKKTTLAEIGGKFTAATKALKGSRAFKKLCKKYGIEHTIRTIETPYGQNGFHPHEHIIAFALRETLRGLPNGENQFKNELYELWRAQLEKQNLWCSKEHGVDVSTSVSNLHNYLTKLGNVTGRAGDERLVQEVARSDKKQGRNNSRSPFELLHDYAFNADRQAGKLFVEYAAFMLGHKRIWYSNSLKEIRAKVAEQAAIEPAEQTAEQSPYGTFNDLCHVTQGELTALNVRRSKAIALHLAAKTNDAGLVRRFISSEREAYLESLSQIASHTSQPAPASVTLARQSPLNLRVHLSSEENGHERTTTQNDAANPKPPVFSHHRRS